MNIEWNESVANPDPVEQFRNWFRTVNEAGVADANAMNVCTVSANKPSCRIMLLKDFSPEGFSFFTNYTSRKADEIRENPNCCLNFFWKELGLQVRIEGQLQMLPAEKSDEYFMTRPRESRVGAWASPQSRELRGRKELEERLTEAEKSFAGKEVTRPSWWGGYLLVPEYYEFWVGRADRLHDRICYVKEQDNWKIKRLAP